MSHPVRKDQLSHRVMLSVVERKRARFFLAQQCSTGLRKKEKEISKFLVGAKPRNKLKTRSTFIRQRFTDKGDDPQPTPKNNFKYFKHKHDMKVMFFHLNDDSVYTVSILKETVRTVEVDNSEFFYNNSSETPRQGPIYVVYGYQIHKIP